MAENKAQDIWDHSNILHQYKNNNIKKVQFGITEVESGYSIYLGGCSEDSKFQNQNQTRKDYIKDLAFQKTVYHSLIVQDLRCYLGISNKTITDEDLLFMMHKTRANSKFLSMDEKRKSHHWLLENNKV